MQYIKKLFMPFITTVAITAILGACYLLINGHIYRAITTAVVALLFILYVAWNTPVDKLKAMSEFFAAVVIPLVIAVVGYFVTDAMKRKEISNSYVNTALGILTAPISLDSHEQNTKRLLRGWAADLLDYYAEVKLPPDVKKAVADGSVELSPAPQHLGFTGYVPTVTISKNPATKSQIIAQAPASTLNERTPQDVNDKAVVSEVTQTTQGTTNTTKLSLTGGTPTVTISKTAVSDPPPTSK